MTDKQDTENKVLLERRLAETQMKLQQMRAELEMYQASLSALKNETKEVYINLGPVLVESHSTRPDHIRTIEQTIELLTKSISDNQELIKFYEDTLKKSLSEGQPKK